MSLKKKRHSITLYAMHDLLFALSFKFPASLILPYFCYLLRTVVGCIIAILIFKLSSIVFIKFF